MKASANKLETGGGGAAVPAASFRSVPLQGRHVVGIARRDAAKLYPSTPSSHCRATPFARICVNLRVFAPMNQKRTHYPHFCFVLCPFSPNQLAFSRLELYFPRMSLLQNSLAHPDRFVRRHIGPNAQETREMLALLGFKNWTYSPMPPCPKKSGWQEN